MFKDYTSDAVRRFDLASKMALETIGELVRSESVDLITKKGIVDTGRLKASMDYDVGKGKVRVGTPITYALFHEMGTRKLKGRPFLKPAVLGKVEAIKKAVSLIFKKVIK